MTLARIRDAALILATLGTIAALVAVVVEFK